MALFVFLKIGQKGTPFGLFSKKNNFVKCYIWGMIYIGNLLIKQKKSATRFIPGTKNGVLR